jgi:hypothetical protein
MSRKLAPVTPWTRPERRDLIRRNEFLDPAGYPGSTTTRRSGVMRATVGDWLMVEGNHLSDPKRHGQILEVHSTDGSPPYLVRWADSDIETLVFPGPDAWIITTDQLHERESHTPAKH